jgi:hypothetical protein
MANFQNQSPEYLTAPFLKIYIYQRCCFATHLS